MIFDVSVIFIRVTSYSSLMFIGMNRWVFASS